MATTAIVYRNKKRIRMAGNQATKRKELRALAIDPKASPDDRAAARKKLQELPRNGAATRVRVRCSLTGRSRGNYRRFGLCRVKFRELALQGMIPGVVKASW